MCVELVPERMDNLLNSLLEMFPVVIKAVWMLLYYDQKLLIFWLTDLYTAIAFIQH